MNAPARQSQTDAPGAPGAKPHWAPAAKSGIGTAINGASNVWFSFGRGVLEEVFHPTIDDACTRELRFIVTDGKDFFSDEKDDCRHEVVCPTPGTPEYRLINICLKGCYRIEKRVLTDPARPTVLLDVQFVPLDGKLDDYRLYVFLNPHLNGQGAGNTAWVGDYKGTPMLFAEREEVRLALAGSAPWRIRSVGYVDHSDGRRELQEKKRLTSTYPRAEKGNVALVGEIDLRQTGGRFLLVVGFGPSVAAAGHRAKNSLFQGFDKLRSAYAQEWSEWQSSLMALERQDGHDLYRTSMLVIRTHQDKWFPGGAIASLATPWGASRGDKASAGYHVLWPRDMAETAGGLLAAGALADAHCKIDYLQATQEPDGHWCQNMWLAGEPFGQGLQLDETALPILLVALARREGALDGDELQRLWPMIRRAAAYLVENGPVTQEDRWERNPGYAPYTLAAVIAALLSAAEHADANGEADVAARFRQTADEWYGRIDSWLYATDTELCRRFGVRGYYVRLTIPAAHEGESPTAQKIRICNHPPGEDTWRASDIVGSDALALVRFGLRAANDPRILDTVRVVDALTKVETPLGPGWHRYNHDGYGEHENGDPFDGTGVGRLWPLLVGERAHYELAAGHREEAERLCRTMEAFAGGTGLIPEQVWDAADIPEKHLHIGRPTGSAMPLVWAHAEYVKLLRSLRDGCVFDMPRHTVERYLRS